MSDSANSHHAFISYASEDRDAAFEICDRLEDAGLSCWIAPRNVHAGQDYGAEIIRGIEASNCIVLVLSQHSNASKFVKAEVERAYSKDKTVFPVRVEDVMPAQRLELFISSSHWIDAFQGDLDEHFKLLAAEISGLSRDDTGLASTDTSSKPVKRSKLGTSRSKTPLIATAIVAVVAVGGFLWQFSKTPDANVSEAPAKSVAVLPFVNMSSDPEQEYFSDGITEEILDDLAKLPDLKVTARTSAFSFKGKDIPIPEIAETLGVANILEGSVRKAGNRVRITAQLIHAADGFHQWSDTYDRELTDIFAIQDDISAAIASALKTQLLGNEEAQTGPTTANVDAYDSLMRLRSKLRTSSGDEMLALIESLETLTRNYPDYSDAYATLAEAHRLHGLAAGLIPEDVMANAFEAGRKSVDLAPENATGYIALGNALLNRGRFVEAAPIVARAMQLQPGNADVLVMQGQLLSIQGRYLKAAELTERALLRDPLNVNTRSALAYLYVSVGQGERAVETLSLGLETDPDDIELLLDRAYVHYDMGRLGLAAASIRQLLELEPSHLIAVQTLMMIQVDAGDLDAAHRSLEHGETLSRSRLADERAMYCYAMDDTDCWHTATTRMLATRKAWFVQTWQARMLYESGLLHEAIQSLLPVVEYFDQTNANYGKYETHTNLAALYHLNGDTERRDAILATIVEPWKFAIEHGYESWTAYFDLASIAAARGDAGEALRNLEEAYARGFRQLWQFELRIAFDKLHDNPEFQSLVERIRSENAAQLAVREH